MGTDDPGATSPDPGATPPDPGAVWTYRGYRLDSRDFNTAMVHYFRAEVSRSNTWRMRLDATTNWAVITTAAALSLTFGSNELERHIMIPLSTILVCIFLAIETRRYRYYELWSYRLRLMESDFFAAMLAPPFTPREGWASALVDSLLHPRFPISHWEAFGRRYRRNFQYIFLLLAAAWVAKVMMHPTPVPSVDAFLARARMGFVPGWAVVLAGFGFNAALFVVGWSSAGLRESKGEVLGKTGTPMPYDVIREAGRSMGKVGMSLPHRHEVLTYIITTRGEEIGQRIMSTFARGVTALDAKGMYTGEDRTVLLVAMDAGQSRHLREAVYAIDPFAFVISQATEHVIGKGFEAPS